jgi:hypothetical protein
MVKNKATHPDVHLPHVRMFPIKLDKLDKIIFSLKKKTLKLRVISSLTRNSLRFSVAILHNIIVVSIVKIVTILNKP